MVSALLGSAALAEPLMGSGAICWLGRLLSQLIAAAMVLLAQLMDAQHRVGGDMEDAHGQVHQKACHHADAHLECQNGDDLDNRGAVGYEYGQHLV